MSIDVQPTHGVNMPLIFIEQFTFWADSVTQTRPTEEMYTSQSPAPQLVQTEDPLWEIETGADIEFHLSPSRNVSVFIAFADKIIDLHNAMLLTYDVGPSRTTIELRASGCEIRGIGDE